MEVLRITNKKEKELYLLPGRQTTSYSILQLIAVSGELPVNQIKQLPGGNRYKEEKIKVLKNKKLIRTYYRDKVRGYRLTSKAKKLLLVENSNRFGFYLTGNTETNTLKSEITRRIRLHRIAETFVTMQNAGVAIYRDQKPYFFCPQGNGNNFIIDSPSFYNSREIKEYGTEFVKISGARTVGVLITVNSAFVVYNLGNALMKWSGKSEMRTKALIKTIFRERLPYRYSPDSVQGLILGNGMELAYQILTGSGKIKKNHFILDGNYDHFHYVSNDSNGVLLLRLICDPVKTTDLNTILLKGLFKPESGHLIENDAINENGIPILFAYDFDMQRIVRFNSALQIQAKEGILICFDFQADVLQRYCSENVKFQTIDAAKFQRRFFPL